MSSLETLWPSVTFTEPPAPEVARRLAAEVRARLAAAGRPLDLSRCCKAAGARVRTARLGVPEGGCEAFLIPQSDGFRIVVDPTPRAGWRGTAPAARKVVARHRRRFRIAHELAHTFFYWREDDREPFRALAHRSDAEELFCDTFARHLLVAPPRRAATAKGIVALHRRFDVSVELAARAATEVHGSSIAVWRWDSPDEGRRAALHVQWSSDDDLPVECGVTEFRTDPLALPRLLASARARLGHGFTSTILPGRRQAIAVLA
jgi:hypothetical protein